MPIDRSGASAAEGALSAAKRILDEGELFGIYPEGTRSHDGKLYRGKTGVARLALETGVPVIPVAVLGTDVVAPPGKKFGTFTRPGVRFGKPLDFSRYEGMENDRYILRSITDEIMYEIMRLSGQEYVDAYATPRQGGVQAPREGREGGEGGEGEGGRRRARRDRRRAPEGVLSRMRLWSRPALAVEDRLFRALAILRVVLLLNAVALNAYRADNFRHPTAGAGHGGAHGRAGRSSSPGCTPTRRAGPRGCSRPTWRWPSACSSPRRWSRARGCAPRSPASG